MTAFTDIGAPLVAVGAKPFASTIQALRDNPISIGEGDPTAIVNAGNWHPYNKVTNGDSNDGRFYSFAVDGLVANRVTPDFADGYEYRVRMVGMSNSVSAADWTIELFRETTGSYSAAYTFTATASAASTRDYEFVMPNVRETSGRKRVEIKSVAYTGANTWTTGGEPVVYLDMSTSQKITRVRFAVSSNNIDAGFMYLDRRRLIL
jgi:hypothetical protein